MSQSNVRGGLGTLPGGEVTDLAEPVADARLRVVDLASQAIDIICTSIQLLFRSSRRSHQRRETTANELLQGRLVRIQLLLCDTRPLFERATQYLERKLPAMRLQRRRKHLMNRPWAIAAFRHGFKRRALYP